MIVKELINVLEKWAPPAYAEEYDNVGLITGDKNAVITGVLCTLDCIEAVVEEAVALECNVIVAHHPIVFKGLKKITGATYVERTIIKAIQHNICIYAIHTNLDSIYEGVNAKICETIGLDKRSVLQPKQATLIKLAVYVPQTAVTAVEQAMFEAGAGNIGNYSECSFTVNGIGAYTANAQANPAMGKHNVRHTEPETRIEVVLPTHALGAVTHAMKSAHPYEEVAYDVYTLVNTNTYVGSGMVGYLSKPVSEQEFLTNIKQKFACKLIRHTALLGKNIQKVAVCGGSGSFLLKEAIRAGADVLITADFKYHEFFDSDNQIIIMDIGHFESEQFTANLLADYIQNHIKNIATFAVRLSGVETNPVKYF